MSEPTEAIPEPVRIPDHDLDDLAATVSRLVAENRTHGQLLDRLTSEGAEMQSAPSEQAAPASEDTQEETDPSSVFILALDDEAYAVELAALRFWVDHLVLRTYGREVTTSRPWCQQWSEHPEAVARLHALWLAWQQFTDVEAGLAGPSIWHRDHLDPALLQLRSADGPFAACTTSAARPNHRLLASPVPASEAA
ncbi:DUF4913 domain-containing protein [Streptomyces silvisoli]|uniref:DUF4913 domain-containing protein n=1 Tax=Streptomyces silvisoli TaxID=3034235 RepID=A0ABT5ZQR2_9ACTN|nr:DUF4913 domain-containing protein [Streptomyces silvisoli]MDF3291894.1 DUF4913 domain-containing protein [Streptomyces silvisoli]